MIMVHAVNFWHKCLKPIIEGAWTQNHPIGVVGLARTGAVVGPLVVSKPCPVRLDRANSAVVPRDLVLCVTV